MSTLAVFVTWDEGEGGGYPRGERCATNTTDMSCRAATLVISPSIKTGARCGTLFNHYSLLGTAEQRLGLSKLGPGGQLHHDDEGVQPVAADPLLVGVTAIQ